VRQTFHNEILKSQTITGNSNSAVFGKGWALEMLLNIRVRGVSGTATPTLKIILQTSPDKVNWANLETETITASGEYAKRITNFGKYVRVAWTVTGTTPSFTGVDVYMQTKG